MRRWIGSDSTCEHCRLRNRRLLLLTSLHYNATTATHTHAACTCSAGAESARKRRHGRAPARQSQSVQWPDAQRGAGAESTLICIYITRLLQQYQLLSSRYFCCLMKYGIQLPFSTSSTAEKTWSGSSNDTPEAQLQDHLLNVQRVLQVVFSVRTHREHVLQWRNCLCLKYACIPISTSVRWPDAERSEAQVRTLDQEFEPYVLHEYKVRLVLYEDHIT